ncbi:HAMP domain-containing sensor histidine kinase [Amycolatopsis sp. SID8362]|uniref:sensor histidine kinase n=1 Tax=Amycolatopsis sp. SID8362 TaxID=2690346 RepID=UPI001370CAD4|nr:HAMP domain-containing sensor histidine kinase [Amycolatopsis sp. SID8362]NBH04074.1 HAMP domain-containing protein [Amycolatopsis sp. SID8362]NED40774.1 HAMP domain-containing histidine kinase [Amycolatopsis sp. SID8362]
MILGATAAAGASYVSARTAILRGIQDQTMLKLRDQITAYLPTVSLPPTQGTLDAFATALKSSGALVVYHDMRATSGIGYDDVPAELRQAVAHSTNIQFQRVDMHGFPMFFVGIPVQTGRNGGQPSGLEVYATVSLTQQQEAIDGLARMAWLYSALALPFAVAVALLAARQVLRPVRALNTAARQLGRGRLDVRLRATGSDELAQLVTTFNNTAAELQRTVGTLQAMEADARRFVADVSHELRTPLAAMNAVTDVLDEDAGQLPADTAVAARLVSAETKRLTRLVQDLIEISRFDAGRAELRREQLDVASAVADSLSARGWEAGADLVVELPVGIAASLDRRRLDIVVANLVGNAMRHGAPPVEVVLRAEGGDVVLTVTDHGPGIPEEVLPTVFDRFTKADTARARSEGSGLGLSIARENARLHGGDITAANTGSGARFELRLPREAW